MDHGYGRVYFIRYYLLAVISDIFQDHNSHGITVYYKNKNNFDMIFYRTLQP